MIEADKCISLPIFDLCRGYKEMVIVSGLDVSLVLFILFIGMAVLIFYREKNRYIYM